MAIINMNGFYNKFESRENLNPQRKKQISYKKCSQRDSICNKKWSPA